jgi:AcrR family transcriptional regulator
LNQKAEKGQATRRLIVETARGLFAARGYAEVSIEQVLRASGVSRGALYHHFAGKEALFEAVVEAMAIEVAKKVVARSTGARDVRVGLAAGCDAFLELTRDPAVRQIVLTDAPSVLGWARWREIDARHGFGLLKASLARASAEGALPAELIEPFAHMLLASLTEVALMIARAGADADAAQRGKAAAHALMERMLGPAAPQMRKIHG